MSHPNNYTWGNINNEGINSKRQDPPINLNNWNQFGNAYQVDWQQQQPQQPPVPLAQVPVPSQQLPNWNNNSFQKLSTVSPQMNYTGDRNYSLNHPQQQTDYVQSQMQPHLLQRSNNSDQFSYDNVINTNNQSGYNTGPQMNYAPVNTAVTPDPWNWGWEETNNSNFTTNNNVSSDTVNNWNVDNSVQEPPTSTFNPIQNYFQQRSNFSDQYNNDIETNQIPISFEPNLISQENDEKINSNLEKNNEISNIKSELDDESFAYENVKMANYSGKGLDFNFDVKSEETQSYHSSSFSNTSEIKTEKLSQDSNKTPLTTQALKEFSKEKYENGPMDFKAKNNMDGLTPQWSIESQMSQETTSDDVSLYKKEESQSDLSLWDSTPGHQQSNEFYLENKCQSSFRSLNLENLKDNLMAEDTRTKQTNQDNKMILPSSSASEKVLDNSSSNHFSLDQRPQDQKSGIQTNSFPKQVDDNFSKKEYSNLVKQMHACNISKDNLNQEIVLGGPGNFNKNNPNQSPLKSDSRFNKKGRSGRESVNQEMIPDNEEKPDAEDELTNEEFRPSAKFSTTNKKSTSRVHQSYTLASDNQEIAPRPDRNQYLETGQLEDQLEPSSTYLDGEMLSNSLPPSNLPRHVPGNNPSNSQKNATNMSSPPPGLHRMVLGQFMENERISGTESNSGRIIQSTPPPLDLHRMVPGQLTDDFEQCSTEEPLNIMSTGPRRNNIPPPGLRRMVPGESSSPETQNLAQLPVDLREQRVVTGVATDEINVTSMQPGMISQSLTPTNRLTNQPSIEENCLQFQSERCETIGSDNLDNYNSNLPDFNSTKLSKRKENKEKDRHIEDISSDESGRDSSRRHDRDSDYYGKRERNRDRDNSSGEWYKSDRNRRLKGRDRPNWERKKESSDNYREEKNRKRDYKEDRRRHKNYRYSDDDDVDEDDDDDIRRNSDDNDDDEDTNDYYSDKEMRSMSRYKEDYESRSRKEERSRAGKSEKSPKSGSDERNSSKNKRRGDRYNDRSLKKNRDRDRDRERDRERDRDRERERDRDRDRDRERDRDRNRERERDRGRKDRDRQSDYGRRRDHNDEYRQRSRPSSRNDSVQDYKHRSNTSDYDIDRDREKDFRGHSKRDMFFPPAGYNYNPAYYTYYYQYYENLRRTNPAAYAEWFRKYYAHSQQGTFDGTFTDDRGSVHSGRSSANDENKDRYINADAGYMFGYSCYQPLPTDQNYPHHSHSSDTYEIDSGRRLNSSLQMESVQRLTPAKFTTAHVKGSFTPRGQLLKILAHYPLDGQQAIVELHENLDCFENIRNEVLDFPGPLVKGVTHKNNILRYCKQKIKNADSNPDISDKESYKLIWELLMLLIRQNGTVVGTDIAELLMSNRTSRVFRQQTFTNQSSNSNEGGSQVSLSEEEITNQFRDYLIYGNTKEALEWAMKHGLWGHALFLASKMDQRTYASVMTRFANGLTMNDPLQTLYQLMSGRQPASVTCCADEKWGDWRPHLAMILSNSTARPDLDLKAVTTLGDTLSMRGNLHAAHFCYLMAQVEFGTFSQKSSKIVLIGSSHSLPFQQFATNEAIFATEIFEFACSLADPDFTLHHLQVYKLLMAKRLTEIGLLQEAVHYVEVISNTIAKFPAQYPPYFIQEVHNLGNMLKYHDPVYTSNEGKTSDPAWLLQLLNILNDYQTGVLQHNEFGSVSNLTTYSENDGVQNLPLDSNIQEPVSDSFSWQNQQQSYYEQSQPHQHQQNLQQPQQQHQLSMQWNANNGSSSNYTQINNNSNKGFSPLEQSLNTSSSVESQNSSYWNNQNQWMPQQQSIPEVGDVQKLDQNNYSAGVGLETVDSGHNPPLYNYYDISRKEQGMPKERPAQGVLTLPGRKTRTYSQSSEDQKENKQRPSKKEPGKLNQSTGSWFGGIWNKLPFRPKNQMILPDDKNPSIVWDSEKNRWVNLNADEDDAASSVPPPPKASELCAENAPKTTAAPASAIPNENSTFNPGLMSSHKSGDQTDASLAPGLPPSGPNKYKMTRGKSLRSNYVDVFNQGTAKPQSPAIAPSDLFPPMNYSSQLPSNYFVPASVEGNENAPVNFLSVSNPPNVNRSSENIESGQPPQQALSRWSSTSSLSREVQKYMTSGKSAGKPLGRTQASKFGNEDYYSNQWSGPPGVSNHPNSQNSSVPKP